MSERLSYAEAARRCGYSVPWVKRRIKLGVLRTVEFAGRTYVSAESVDGLVGGYVIDREGGFPWRAKASAGVHIAG